jgi:MoxR-like ATPase
LKKKKVAPQKSLPKSSAKLSQKRVGRSKEFERLSVCLMAERSVLLEGPVGVGKTFLALSVSDHTKKSIFRVDGDSRYTEQKLSGWFDPPTVLRKGYGKESFIPGPLVEAMESGGILFINELNRLPEGVQNVLLPALDEKMILVPRLGVIRAKPGFQILATQNPKEFVATSHLSEAILDRFELISMDYQSEGEEIEIVEDSLRGKVKGSTLSDLSRASVRLVRGTRNHPKIRRGASIRAAISVADLTVGFLERKLTFKEAFLTAVLLALPTRIEIERSMDSNQSLKEQVETILKELAELAIEDETEKKKI